MLFQDLKALVTVIDCASLTKAAQTLHLTQSAVSRRIQHLEETLGVELFDRTTRPPSPNAMGYRVYEKAVEVLREAQHLLSIPQERAMPSGRFRVGLTQIVADAVMFDVVKGMREQFPHVEMQVVTDWSTTLEQMMLRAELDAAALMVLAPNAPPLPLRCHLITTLDILVVQSKQKPLVSAAADVHSLSSLEWVLNPQGCGYRAALEAAMGARGQRLKLAVDTQGSAMQMRMVAAGMGLGLIPQRLLQAMPNANELSVVHLNDFELNMGIWVAHASQPGNLRQANELLIQAVTDGLQ